jgi:hypothetical protein
MGINHGDVEKCLIFQRWARGKRKNLFVFNESTLIVLLGKKFLAAYEVLLRLIRRLRAQDRRLKVLDQSAVKK